MASFDLIDTAMKGELVPSLEEWRKEGLSQDAMARRLSEQGFSVSRETIRRWFLELDREQS